jgi:non-homologous end joining protein Ku
VDKASGEEDARADIYHVYTCEDGTEVPLDNDEIAKALGCENGNAVVLGFYPADQITRYETENLLQVRPKSAKTKVNPYDKPFALLMGAMESTGTFALIEFTLRGKPSLGTLDHKGNLRVVLWENEVREARPLPDYEAPETEFNMAVALVESMKQDEAPQVHCTAVDRVREFAEAKAAAMGGSEAPEAEVRTNNEALSDLTAALAASIAAAKAAKQTQEV